MLYADERMPAVVLVKSTELAAEERIRITLRVTRHGRVVV
jgi:hypothetical protein